MLQGLKAILTDQNLFNYLLIVLYMASATRHLFAGNWWDVLYWVGATCLTVGVTFR